MKYMAIAASGAGLTLALTVAGVATAQVTTASPGYLFPNDRYTREREEAQKKSRNASPPRTSARCSADDLPAADRRRMETEYVRRTRADGKASADAWVREQGMRFRQQLIARGVC